VEVEVARVEATNAPHSKSESASLDAALVEATASAFGAQWTEFALDAAVSREDLLLHLPSAWDESVFSGRVLDVGCGMGRYTALAADHGAEVVGIDLSGAVEKAAELWPHCSFVQGDIMAPPFTPRSFDLVYSFGVLHHLPDPIRGLCRCYELVKPGGRLLVWVYSSHGGILRGGRRIARKAIRQAPLLLRPLAYAAAGLIFLTYVAPSKITGRHAGKLSYYRSKGFWQLFVDCHDALAAPTELYLSEQDCREWLCALGAPLSGFERRGDGSGWILWAVK
jgi:SAM-dependent methyltransferase